VKGEGTSLGRRAAFRIGAVVLATALVLGLAETSLRLWPFAFLSDGVMEALFDRYNSRPGGMYFREDRTGMQFMWPSFETRAFSHGYFWSHRTDARGFRNPPGARAGDAVLLGDSMIYGHGVEEEQSVAGILRTRYRRAVYNMARQGDCLYQNYVIARLYLEELRPRFALLFFFHNDFVDLKASRAPEQLESGVEVEGYDYRAIRADVERIGRGRTDVPWYRRPLVPQLLAAAAWPAPAAETRADRPAYRRGREQLTRAREKEGDAGLRRLLLDPRFERFLDRRPGALRDQDLARGHDYYARILADLGRRCEAQGTRLVVIDIAEIDPGGALPDRERLERQLEQQLGADVPKAILDEVAAHLRSRREDTAARVRSLAADAARIAGVEWIDATGTWLDCAQCRLEHDGHLSPEGHLRLARFLDRLLATGNPAKAP
jgi:hypothetical protein